MAHPVVGQMRKRQSRGQNKINEKYYFNIGQIKVRQAC